jgi:UDP-glucose 4-epimerase
MKKLLTKLISRLSIDGIYLDYLPDRPADVPRLWVDNSKVKEVVFLDELMSFDEGLDETIEFYKKLKKERDLLVDLEIINWKK